jgi:glucose/mannose-6-phosphate isomerase
LTSGGDLHTLAANENRFLIQIPKGYQPRCALAYSFFPLLILTSKLGFVADVTSGILKVKNNLVSKSELYCLPDNDRNSAVNLAKHIEGTLPVIYSSSDVLDIVNLRWRCQLNENAKTLAYGNLLPEMNHNEIVGWQHMQELMKKIAVISMIDREDNSRVKRRMEITLSLISNQRGKLIEVEGEGETRLERIFDLIHLGDWVSFYLAILYKEDPTPVEFITFLKNRLTES